MSNDLLIETNMHYESSDNDRRQTRQNIKDLTYGRSKSGACRGVPVGRGRRGTEEPPDPSATREMSRINMFVRRGVDHDTAGGGNRSLQSSPLLQEPGKSFTVLSSIAAIHSSAVKPGCITQAILESSLCQRTLCLPD